VNQWWLSTDRPDAGQPDSARIRAAVEDLGAAPAQVLVRSEIADQLRRDPLGGAAAGAFDVALSVGVVLVGVGLLVAGAVNAGQRRVELAVLRALGVTTGQLRRALLAEQGVVVGAAVLAGVLTGAAVSWLTLPQLVMATDATPVPPQLRFSLTGVLVGVGAIVVAAVLAAVARLLAARRRPPAADVRLGADT
jgi:hypothetical protein